MVGAFGPSTNFHVDNPEKDQDIDADSMKVNTDPATQEAVSDVVEPDKAQCKDGIGGSKILCHAEAKAQLLMALGAWARDQECSHKE